MEGEGAPLTRALAAAALACLAVTGARAEPPAVLDALLSEGRITAPLAELAETAALREGQDFRVVEIGRDAHTSHHVVAIRHAETPHRHDRHDLVVTMLEGHGHMRIGDAERPVGPGSILYVPRGTVHAFRNAADAPAVAYVVYAPAFDGTDRVLEEEGRPAGPAPDADAR